MSESCVMKENEIINLIQHFDKFSLDQPIAWYSNIDLNIELSNEWRNKVTTPVTFSIWRIRCCCKINR